jgi:HEAT repeat protein
MKRLLLLALGLGLTVAANSASSDDKTPARPEPVYHGRPLRAWLDDLDDADVLVREEAMEVLGQAGPAAREALPALNRMLKDENRNLRVRAALALWRIGKDARPAVAALSENLRSSSTPVRREAIHTLQQIGKDAIAAAPAILDLADDRDFNIRQQARSTLTSFGKAALPAVLKGLDDKEARRRRNAADVLAENLMWQLSKENVPTLTPRLKDTDRHVRATCARALWQLGDTNKPVLDALLDGVLSGDITLQRNVLNTVAFAPHKPKSLQPLLEEAVKLTDLNTRIQAAQVLFQVDNKSDKVMPVLLEALKPQYRNNWHQVLNVLQQMGPRAKPALDRLLVIAKDQQFQWQSWQLRSTLAAIGEPAIPGLVQLLKSGVPPGFQPDHSPAETAAYALGQIGVKAADAVTPLLTDKDDQVRLRACKVIGNVGAPAKAAAPKLITALKDDHAGVREAAATALGNMGADAKASIPALLALAKGTDAAVRRASMKALTHIGPDAKDAVPVCLDALKDTDTALRVQALELLAKVDPGHSEIVPQATKLLEDPQSRQLTLGVLGRMGEKAEKAVPEMMKLLSDPNEQTRREAAQALGQIGPAARAATATLADMLKTEKNQWMHSVVLTALANIGGDPAGVVPKVVEYMKIHRNYTINQAIAVLAVHGTKAAEAATPLLDVLRDNALNYAHAHAAEALAKVDPALAKKEAAPLLRKAVQAQPQNLMVARALLEIDAEDKDALKAITDSLRSTQPYQKAQAAVALGVLGTKAAKFADEIKPMLKDTQYYVRGAAAVGYWRITGKDEEALPVLRALLKDPQNYVRNSTVYWMAELGPLGKKAVPDLKKLRHDPDMGVRTSVENALKKIDRPAAKDDKTKDKKP